MRACGLFGGVVLGLSACRSGASDAVLASIGPEGGTVEATSADGATLTLEVPPGAFARTVELTLLPLPPGDDLALFQVDPPGLVPAVPIQATLTLDGDLPDDAGFLWADADGRVPLGGAVEGGALVFDLPMLGYRSGDGAEARTRGEAAPPAPGEGRIAAAPIDCATALAAVPAEYQRVLATGDADAVGRFLSSVQAMQQRCQEQEARDRVIAICADYTTALEAARGAVVSDDAALQRAIGPLLAANAATEMAGGTCDTTQFVPVMTAKIGEHLQALRDRYAATSVTDSLETHLDHLDELLRYEGNCQVAGIPEGACGPLVNGLYPDVLDALRNATYAECRATQNPQPVEALYVDPRDPGVLAVREEPFFRFARYTNEALEDDVLHCANRVEVTVVDDAATLPDLLEDQTRVLEGGATPGTHVREASVNAPTDGSILFAGVIRSPPCPVPDPGEDVIVARIDDIEVGRSARNGDRFLLSTTPMELLVSHLLNPGGVPEGSGEFDIVLTREESGCPSFATPHPLYTLHVFVGEPLITATAAPDTDASYSVPTAAYCEEDDDDAEVTYVALGVETPLPASVTAGGASIDLRLVGGRQIVVSGTVAEGPTVTDFCTDGSHYTAFTYGSADATVNFTAAVPVTFTNASTNPFTVIGCVILGPQSLQPGDLIPANTPCLVSTSAGAPGTFPPGNVADFTFTAVPTP